MNYDVHVARGVSALSRNSSHTEYRGLVNILIILLLVSNARILIAKAQTDGWIIGRLIFETITSPQRLTVENYINFAIIMHWIIVAPIISYFIEKFLAVNAMVPRRVIWISIFLNMVYVLSFPIYCVQKYKLNALAS